MAINPTRHRSTFSFSSSLVLAHRAKVITSGRFLLWRGFCPIPIFIQCDRILYIYCATHDMTEASCWDSASASNLARSVRAQSRHEVWRHAEGPFDGMQLIMRCSLAVHTRSRCKIGRNLEGSCSKWRPARSCQYGYVENTGTRSNAPLTVSP